ncbi:MAG: hypothetical protein ACFCUV_27665 [Rivularia sp. (in: cyanobacteria)]
MRKAVRRLQDSEQENISVNNFFQKFYQTNAFTINTMEGRQHTGQRISTRI